jgi:Na+/citrate or Na+/malate symporter
MELPKSVSVHCMYITVIIVYAVLGVNRKKVWCKECKHCLKILTGTLGSEGLILNVAGQIPKSKCGKF